MALKIWNLAKPRGGHFYMAAESKREAARLLLKNENRGLENDKFMVDRQVRHLTTYGSEGAWGDKMKGVEIEKGLWECEDTFNAKPKRLI